MEMVTAPRRDPLAGVTRARQLLTDTDFRAELAAANGVPADTPALLKFLALCIDEGFSPVADHVWLLPKRVLVPSEDGNGETEDSVLVPMVGRDGLLHKARQSKGLPGGFRGLRAGVICEKDEFEVEDDGDEVTVLHRYASKPTTDVGDDMGRGKVLGAWAKCFIDGEPPTFYVASLAEHGQTVNAYAANPEAGDRSMPLYYAEDGVPTFERLGPNRVPRQPVQILTEMWRYLSTMILKSAQSYVLRIALGVTGFVPADELRDIAAWQASPVRASAATAAPTTAAPAFDLAEIVKDPQLRERLRGAIEDANSLVPMSWGPAKQSMALRGKSPRELREIAERIENDNAARRDREDGAARRVELEKRAAALRKTLDGRGGKAHKAAAQSELDQVEAELADLGDR